MTRVACHAPDTSSESTWARPTCALAYVDTKGRERPSADIKPYRCPSTGRGRRDRPAPDAPFVPLPTRSSRTSRRRGQRALEPGGRPHRRRIRSRPGLTSARPPRLERQELALSRGSRSRGRDSPLGFPDRRSPVSPVEASADFLRHLRDAWNHSMARRSRAYRLEQQEVVLTVPASFDEAARELTIEAAKRAGLETSHAAGRAAGGVLLLDRLAPGAAGSSRFAPAN